VSFLFFKYFFLFFSFKFCFSIWIAKQWRKHPGSIEHLSSSNLIKFLIHFFSSILYVGGLDENVNEEILRASFLPFGDIVDVMIPIDNDASVLLLFFEFFRVVLCCINFYFIFHCLRLSTLSFIFVQKAIVGLGLLHLKSMKMQKLQWIT